VLDVPQLERRNTPVIKITINLRIGFPIPVANECLAGITYDYRDWFHTMALCTGRMDWRKREEGFSVFSSLTPLQKGDLSTTETTEIAETKDNFIVH